MTRLDATFATQARCAGLTAKGLVPIADDLLDDVWVLPHGVVLSRPTVSACCLGSGVVGRWAANVGDVAVLR